MRSRSAERPPAAAPFSARSLALLPAHRVRPRASREALLLPSLPPFLAAPAAICPQTSCCFRPFYSPRRTRCPSAPPTRASNAGMTEPKAGCRRRQCPGPRRQTRVRAGQGNRVSPAHRRAQGPGGRPASRRGRPDPTPEPRRAWAPLGSRATGQVVTSALQLLEGHRVTAGAFPAKAGRGGGSGTTAAPAGPRAAACPPSPRTTRLHHADALPQRAGGRAREAAAPPPAGSRTAPRESARAGRERPRPRPHPRRPGGSVPEAGRRTRRDGSFGFRAAGDPAGAAGPQGRLAHAHGRAPPHCPNLAPQPPRPAEVGDARGASPREPRSEPRPAARPRHPPRASDTRRAPCDHARPAPAAPHRRSRSARSAPRRPARLPHSLPSAMSCRPCRSLARSARRSRGGARGRPRVSRESREGAGGARGGGRGRGRCARAVRADGARLPLVR